MLTAADIESTVGGKRDADFVEKAYPAMVTGRTAHIDADFLAYMASYERKDEDSSLDDILHRTDVMIKDKRLQAGCDRAVLHVTPNTSDKGGRYDVAIQRKYQGQRKSDTKPRYLETVRSYMADMVGTHTGANWETAEADDGMAEAAWKEYHAGHAGTIVIVTKDKDLRMCPGLHLDWDTGNLHDCGRDTFGSIEIQSREGKVDPKTGKPKITKKPHGWGTKWFWMQLLMGDTADHIRGCPKAWINGKHKACGAIGAYDLLATATDDLECLRTVMQAYKSNTYTHWETGDVASWQDVFWSEAQMLWMQRTPGDINDVKIWTKEMLNGV